MSDLVACPRCGSTYPARSDVEALSRSDNKTLICSACGSEEAIQQMAGRDLVGPDQWPVKRVDTPRPTAFQNPDWRDQRSERSHRPNPVPAPKEIPDLRLHLLERWVPGGVFDKYFSAPGFPLGLHERNTLRHASLWWIKDDMVDLTVAAAKTIPSDLLASEIDLPAEQAYGLAVLEKPWTGSVDANDPDNTVTVHAFTWSPTIIETTPCLSLTFYQYLDFAGGMSPSELQVATASGLIHDAKVERIRTADGQRVERLLGGAWMPLGSSDWPLSARLDDFTAISQWSHLEDHRRRSMEEDRRWFAALCVLVNHRLSEQETVLAARQTRRRTERAGVAPESSPSTVRLVRLRQAKREHPEGDEPTEKRHIEYTHRWMVSGHMAWRACGPRREQRRLVFVTPHVRGPADKPLVIKDTVRVWTR